MRLVAIMGAKRSGKTLVAEELMKLGAIRVRFADPLKSMLLALGLEPDDVDGTRKEKPHPLLCGKTPRHAMQVLGTEWRDMISKDLWTNILVNKIKKMRDGHFNRLSANQIIVVDDCRFPHEIEAIRSLGGKIVVVRRPEVEPTNRQLHLSRCGWFGRLLLRMMRLEPLHLSEVYWVDALYEQGTKEIWNDGTREEFREKVRRMSL